VAAQAPCQHLPSGLVWAQGDKGPAALGLDAPCLLGGCVQQDYGHVCSGHFTIASSTVWTARLCLCVLQLGGYWLILYACTEALKLNCWHDCAQQSHLRGVTCTRSLWVEE
jgi:hypothetical protein